MKKTIIILLSIIMLTATGCSENSKNSPKSSATESENTATRLDYEFYIESMNFYMDSYTDAGEKQQEATEKLNQATSAEDIDFEELKKAYGLCVSALEDFSELQCPENIKTEHDEFMAQIETEKEIYELLLRQIYFEENKETLTDAEKEEQTAVSGQLSQLLNFDENAPTLWDLRNKVIDAALKYI